MSQLYYCSIGTGWVDIVILLASSCETNVRGEGKPAPLTHQKTTRNYSYI